MVRKATLCMAAVLAFAGTPAGAACPYPDEVAIPDGSTATEAEMLEGQRRVRAYIAALEEYNKCLEREARALGDAQTPEQKALHTQRHNAAVTAMESAADRFNAEIGAYKTANP